MRIAIIQFPGSTCQRETRLAVKRAGMEPIDFLSHQSRDTSSEFDGYIIVGGVADAVIAAHDPIMQVLRQQSDVGKPILGIANGAQILVESGLVPNLALSDNKRMRDGRIVGTGFYNAWINIRLADAYQYNAFTRNLTSQTILSLPIASAQSRFIIPPALLLEMTEQGLGVFQYCDARGMIVDTYPINPNGSVKNIAAVSNKAGNVMAIIPHPERSNQGDAIFKSMRDHIAKGYREQVAPLHYLPRPERVSTYCPPVNAHEVIVDTDALTVEKTLNQLGIPVRIKREVHWEIVMTSEIENSLPTDKIDSQQVSFLVRAKDDIEGRATRQSLEQRGIEGIRSIHRSVLWHISADANLQELAERVRQTGILYNTYADDCYYYNSKG